MSCPSWGDGPAGSPPEPQGVILGLPLPHPSVTERYHGWPRGTVPQGHGLAVTGPPPNACLSNCKGNQEKLEIKERKELIRILAQPQWLCFRRADTTRSLMPVLRGLRKEVGFGRCSGAFLVDVSAFQSSAWFLPQPVPPPAPGCRSRPGSAAPQRISHCGNAVPQRSGDFGGINAFLHSHSPPAGGCFGNRALPEMLGAALSLFS